MKSAREYRRYLEAGLDSLEDELVIVDRDLRIIGANRAVLTRHKKSRKKIIGQHCYEVSHGLSEPCHPSHGECPIRLVWQTGKPARATHLHVYDGDQEKRERYLDIIASPILNGQGEVVAVAELMRDVTEAKETEMKLAEAHRSLLALNAIATVVGQSLDLDTVLSNALDKTLEIMKVNTGGILLWDEERELLCYRVHHGLSHEYVQGVCYRLGEGITGRVVQTGQAILVEDISTDPRAIRPELINAEGLRAFASVPLRSKDKVLGALNIASEQARKFSAEDVQLLESIATQVAVAVENAKLHHEVQRQDERRGELLREMFSIQEEERKRIARELHDETMQSLASLAASLEAIAGTLPEGASQGRAQLKKLQSLSISILDEIHRLIYELRPTLLDDLGLVAATRWLAENNLGAAGVAVTLKVIGRERRLSSQLETTLFRVLQEAINNIARHAQARKASISLDFKRKAISVKIKDDGRGFDVDEAISSKERPRGLGLLGMKERVELFNGTFRIRSGSAQRGTQIDITIPINGEVGNE
ncbi:MAG TPA: GAF domain-containing protein [Dehalococcoidia bacterium]|jgi:signal transduction histidine kinase|nr:GAF domain-containing protein [Dehalococcoidia bacterium]